MPVAHRPINLVILNMCVTSEASMSLSCGKRREDGQRAVELCVNSRPDAKVRSTERGSRLDRGTDATIARVRTGIFFCVTTHTLSLPRTPIDVIPTDLIALNAYSVGRRREKRRRQRPMRATRARPDPRQGRRREGDRDVTTHRLGTDDPQD